MKKDRFIYVTGVKNVKQAVFGVDTNLKTYYDAVSGKYVPYASGQQVKRSFFDFINEEYSSSIEKIIAPFTVVYNFDSKKTKFEQKESYPDADNSFFTSLVGGYMKAPTKDKNKKKNEEEDDKEDKEVYTRRSPIAFSYLTALHPDLTSTTVKDEIGTSDRSDIFNDNMSFTCDGKKSLDEEEALKLMAENNLQISKRKIYSPHRRANGLFKFDAAIDLERLFRVPIKKFNKEIDDVKHKSLVENGWKEVNVNGVDYLELPSDLHGIYAEAIAEGLVEFRFKSNQSRSLDLMPTVSFAVTNKASKLPLVYRTEFDENNKRKLVIETGVNGVQVFNSPLVNDILSGVDTDINFIDEFKECIKNSIIEYYK